MIRKNLIGALALACALGVASVARAQEQPAQPGGGLRPTDGAPSSPDPVAPAPAPAAPEAPPQVEGAPKAPPADPGNWKGQAPPAQGSDPLAAPAAPAAPKDPNYIANDDPRAGRIIDKNYSDAIKVYEGVLKNDGESVENLDHRIESNEKLVANYKKKLNECNEAKRRMQVELFNRTFYLKQQRDKGAIPDDVYEKMVKNEEKKYNDRSASTTSDIAFYEKEIQDAEGRLNGLRAERRIQVTTTKSMMAASGKPKKPPMTASQRLTTSLKDRLSKVWPAETKNPMDGAPVCEECLKPGAAPSAPQGEPPAVAAGQNGGS